jgi:hypothetical protein
MTPRVVDEDETEDFLDCTGKPRTFKLEPYSNDLWLQAVEVTGEAAGLRFCLPARDGVLAWGEMREKIRRRLAQRDVVRTPEGKLVMLTHLVRGQVASTSSTRGERGPRVLVDDMEISWEELGRLLECYEGWHFRLDIKDASEAP